MNLYRTEDIQAITDKLDQITDSAINIRNKLLEPMLDEHLQILDVIREFIIRKKRIVYGGQAFQELIKKKDQKSGIYTDSDRKDIEFYTPEPIEDVVELSNILHDKGFQWVQGAQAFHDETYKIFVNFDECCDMSYMPRNIFGNMPTVTIDKIRYSHPSWIMVDMLRQYNDPVLSYWRLKDKTFFRTNLLLKYYAFNLETKNRFKPSTKSLDHKKKLFDELIKIESIIFIGSIAEQFYLTRNSSIDFSKMEIYSVNFKNDIKTINLLLETILGNDYKNIVINVYKPFFQFRDERIDFLLNGDSLLQINGNNCLCVPYNNLYIKNESIDRVQAGGFYKEQKGSSDETVIKIGTFILVFNYVLIKRHYEYINRRDDYKKYEYILSELLKSRAAYFKKKSLNVMDNSPYKEFVMRCTGKTMDSIRQYRINQQIKREKKQLNTFRYDPARQKEDFKKPDYKFKNTSGNISKSDISKLFN